jgi:hypothetical protein
MMKVFMKTVALTVCGTILLTSTSYSSSAKASINGVDYKILSPYEQVDWASVKQCKTNLHCHTIVSDGNNNFSDMIEKHYALGYDFLAITDHATVDYSWTDVNSNSVFSVVAKFKRLNPFLKPKGLSEKRYQQITQGQGRGGRGMLRVPYGIENNAASLNNTHVNSWFVDYGDGAYGGTSDYETVLKGVEQLGGLSVINHPGEYTGTKKEKSADSAYNSDYSYYIKKFANLLLKYKSCIGLDVNSMGDYATKYDRKLWDAMLKNCIPAGRNVFAIATSDAHGDNKLDSGLTVHCLEDKTIEDLRASLENGTFFALSRHIMNEQELTLIGEAIGECLGSQWVAAADAEFPKINSIIVDEESDAITISDSHAKLIRWIADGEQIATGERVDLDDYSGRVGSYVRAEVFGDGGVLYTQAFVLQYQDAPEAESMGFFFDFGNILAFLRRALLSLFDS